MPGQIATTENSPAQIAHHQNSAPPHSGVAPLDAVRLKQIYASMLKCHLAQQRMNVDHGKLRRCSFGEATLVPAMIDLHAGDILALSSTDLVSLIAAGQSLRKVVADIPSSRRRSSLAGMGASARDTVNMQVGMAVGAAMVCKMQRESNVVLALCGSYAALDSAQKTLRFAGRQRLPIVIVAQDAAKRTQPPKRDYGFPAIPVDAHDAVAVYRVAQEAIHKARKGTGPTLILCSCVSAAKRGATSDNAAIQYMEAYMRRRHAWSDEWKQQVEEQIEKEICDALRCPTNSAVAVDSEHLVRVFSVCD